MQVLTSLSGLPISAVSAGFAPTNSADVSAIASAYQVVSSTATQLHAGTAYLTSVNGAPISASRAGQAANASLATSAYYDGTGRLISALPDSAAVSAIASSYAESAASGKQDTIEFGYDANNLISSIDGSALAGGGGGGLITSIESALDPWYRTAISGLNGSSLYPKWAESAHSADNATNAQSANYAASAPTAWASSFITGVASPSGTIRVLSGTAIEATNSALLPSTLIPGFESASAISPATSIGPDVFLTGTIPSENPYTNLVLLMGWGELTVSITGNNGETASVSKGNSDEFVTAQLPNATSYSLTTDAWVSVAAITASAETQEIGGGVGELAWASALPTYEYDGDGKISAIDGSAIAGGGGGATGDYVEKSATSVVIGPSSNTYQYSLAAGGKVSAFQQSLAVGSASIASTNSIAVGDKNSADYESVAVGSYASAYHYSEAFGFYALAENNSFAHKGTAKYGSVAFGNGTGVSAYENSVAIGSGVTSKFTSMVFGTNNLSGDGSGASGAAFVIGDGTSTGSRHDLMVVTKDGEITMFSGTADTVGTGIMSSIRAISAAATGGGGGVDSATVSAIASAYVESGVSSKLDSSASSSFYTTANESGFVDSAYVESAVSGKMDSSASSSFYTTANESGFITGVDLTDYATTAYVDSAVSGKMDASAIDYTRTGGGTQIYASGNGSSTNQFSAKNDSAGAAIIAGENARLRLWDTAATANLYASSIGGWNAAANLVSSQSANWGGSALQLSAGPGVTLTKSGNLLVAGLDETVLWSGNLNTTADKITLSEPFENFDSVDIYWRSYGRYYVNRLQGNSRLQFGQVYCDGNYPQITTICYDGSYTGTEYTFNSMYHQAVTAGSNTSTTDLANIGIKKIVGINRTAEA